jgi:hypothetical protein
VQGLLSMIHNLKLYETLVLRPWIQFWIRGVWTFCNQVNFGIFLFSTAIANSTMDYSTKMIENGVVDSPPSCDHILQGVSLPSPLRVRTKAATRLPSFRVDLRSSRK